MTTDTAPEAADTPAESTDAVETPAPAADAAPTKKKKRNRLGVASFIFALILTGWLAAVAWFGSQTLSQIKLTTVSDAVNAVAGPAPQILSGLVAASLGVVPLLGFITLLLGILALALNGVPGKLLGLLSVLVVIASIVAIVIGVGYVTSEIGRLADQYGPAVKSLLPILGPLLGIK
jgi:hypothetical protein